MDRTGATITLPHGDTFEAHFRARMAELGRKGGKVSGAKRMENLSDRQRREIALKAAKARWRESKARGTQR
jgi:general stress protein YciG